MMEIWFPSISGLYPVPVYGAGTHGKDYGTSKLNASTIFLIISILIIAGQRKFIF